MYTGVLLPGVAVHENFFYVFFGWVSSIQDDSDSVFRTNLSSSTYEWEEVLLEGDGTTIARDSFAFSLYGDSYYMFGGYTNEGLKNSLVTFNMSSTNLSFT